MDTCPVCHAEMASDTQLGPWCPNSDCPVVDDADLWYRNDEGKWDAQHWIIEPSPDNPYGYNTMRLSEKEL